jgi:hypothetical protein
VHVLFLLLAISDIGPRAQAVVLHDDVWLLEKKKKKEKYRTQHTHNNYIELKEDGFDGEKQKTKQTKTFLFVKSISASTVRSAL